MRWKRVHSLMTKKSDGSTEAIFTWLEKTDSLTVWEEYVADNYKKEEDAKAKERYDFERRARDSFRKLMREQYEMGHLKYNSTWPEVVKRVSDDARYNACTGAACNSGTGSTPKELFIDLKFEIRAEF